MQSSSVTAKLAPVQPNVQEDQAPALNVFLSSADVRVTELPSGIIWVAQSVRVPAGKSLALQSDTIIRALPSYSIIGGRNHVVLLEGNRAGISGGTVDANKVGLGQGGGARINGVTVFNGARDCRRENMQITNCTGYASYDSGTNDRLTPPSSLNIGVSVSNSQIHFEQQGADGSTYISCTSRDGDGDVPCLSWIHPLVGSRRTSFIGFDGFGATPVGVDVAANIANIEDIHFYDVRIELTNSGGVGMNVNSGNNDTNGLKVVASKFITNGGIGVVLSQATGSFAQCDFFGQTGVEHADSSIQFIGCNAIVSSATTATPVGIVVTGAGKAQWQGGSINGTATGGVLPLAFRGSVLFGGGTRTSPAMPSVPVVRQEAYGTVDVVSVDTTHSIANVFLPFVQQDLAKCFLTTSLRKTNASSAPNLGASTITWASIGAGQLRIYIDGVNLAQPSSSYQLNYHIVERE